MFSTSLLTHLETSRIAQEESSDKTRGGAELGPLVLLGSKWVQDQRRDIPPRISKNLRIHLLWNGPTSKTNNALYTSYILDLLYIFILKLTTF